MKLHRKASFSRAGFGLCETRRLGIKWIPGLRTVGVHHLAGLEEARIVEARSADDAYRGALGVAADRRAASGAEDVQYRIAAAAGIALGGRLAGQRHGLRRKYDVGHVPRTAETLAIAALGEERETRLIGDLVADRAAMAPPSIFMPAPWPDTTGPELAARGAPPDVPIEPFGWPPGDAQAVVPLVAPDRRGRLRAGEPV